MSNLYREESLSLPHQVEPDSDANVGAYVGAYNRVDNFTGLRKTTQVRFSLKILKH